MFSRLLCLGQPSVILGGRAMPDPSASRGCDRTVRVPRGRAGTRPAPDRRRRPAVEGLEHRELPASLLTGGIVVGSIDHAGEVDRWTFAGTRGNQFELITAEPAGQPGFYLYADVIAPSGTLVATAYAGSDLALYLQ